MDALPETTMAEFIRYNNWANQQVLEACQKLTEDQLALRCQVRMARSATPWSTLSKAKLSMWVY